MSVNFLTRCCVNVLPSLGLAPARSAARSGGWILLKKTTRYIERNHSKRMWFLHELRLYVKKYGSKNIVYFDESGFAANVYRTHGWAERGVKIHGDITGNHHRGRTNLIMAQRGKEWLAPMLFEGGCHTELVNDWVRDFLLPELTAPSLIIMDNARFHNKENISNLLAAKGHKLMPLPPYSPDFNPIEQSFAIIKKRRIFNNQSLQQILMGNS